MKKTAVCVLLLTGIIAICGCNSQSRNNLSSVSKERVNQQEAALVAAVERNYGDARAHYALGKYYQETGLLDKAEFEYNIALGFDPVNRDAQAAMVKVLMQKNQHQKAQQYANLYLEQVKIVAEDSLLLGRAFQRECLDDYALRCFEQALCLAPNSAALHKQIGFFYLCRGDKVRAEEYLKRSFQLDPYQPDVACELGKMGVVVTIPQKPKSSFGQSIGKMFNFGGKKQASLQTSAAKQN